MPIVDPKATAAFPVVVGAEVPELVGLPDPVEFVDVPDPPLDVPLLFDPAPPVASVTGAAALPTRSPWT